MVFPYEILSPMAFRTQPAKALSLLPNNVPSLPLWGYSMAMKGNVYWAFTMGCALSEVFYVPLIYSSQHPYRVPVIIPFNRWEKWGSEGWCDFPSIAPNTGLSDSRGLSLAPMPLWAGTEQAWDFCCHTFHTQSVRRRGIHNPVACLLEKQASFACRKAPLRSSPASPQSQHSLTGSLGA